MKSLQIQTRYLTERDYPSFKNLFEILDEYHCKALPDLFKNPKTTFRTKEHFLKWFNDPAISFIGAECNNEIVGIIQLVKKSILGTYPIQLSREVLLIDNLIVSPKMREKGIGRKLIERALELAKESNIINVELHVFEFNTDAIEFYKGLGFETQSRRMSLNL